MNSWFIEVSYFSLPRSFPFFIVPPMPPRSQKAKIDLKVRMREPLRAKIERAAKSRGVSLNAEAVERLELSFADNDARARDFGDETTLHVMRALATAKQIAELSTGKSAYEDPETAQLALTAMKRVLAALFVLLPRWQADKND